jgi:hypothetical protein
MTSNNSSSLLKTLVTNLTKHILAKRCLKLQEQRDHAVRKGMSMMFTLLQIRPIDWVMYEIPLMTNPRRSTDTIEQYLERSAALLACFLQYFDRFFPNANFLASFQRCYWQIVAEYDTFRVEENKDRVRSFRQAYIPAKDALYDSYGFNISRIGIPGSWNSQQKEHVFYVAAVLRWLVHLEMSENMRNLALAALYVVCAIGENSPAATSWKDKICEIVLSD